MAQSQQYISVSNPPPPPKQFDGSPIPTHYSMITSASLKNNSLSIPRQSMPYTTSLNNKSAPSLTVLRQSSPLPSHDTSMSKTPPGTRSSSITSVSLNDPLLDHSHLKPGTKASLLSYAQTINMYRNNAKKTNNPDIQCDFAVFLVEAAKPIPEEDTTRWEYLSEAEKLLKQLSARGHAESQYYLGNLFASGLLSKKGKNEFEKAFPLFVQATKHHHADAAYR